MLTAYIDGSAVYGSTNEEAKKLREFKHGKLKISADNMLPHEDDSKKTCLIPLDDSDKKCFQAGRLTTIKNTDHRVVMFVLDLRHRVAIPQVIRESTCGIC